MKEPPRWILLLLLTLTAVSYIGVLNAGWILDDHALILKNPALTDGAALAEGLKGELWKGTGYWRPILLVDFFLDRQFAGENAALWHIGNLFWHLLNVGLLYGFLRRLRLEVRAALLGTVLFALHPIQSEAVIWVSARNDLLATAFTIGSLYLATSRMAWAGGLLAGLALLSKESAVGLPLVGVAVAHYYRGLEDGKSGQAQDVSRETLAYAGSSFLVFAGIFALRSAWGLSPTLPDPLPLLRAFPTVLGSYVNRILLPQPLFSQHLDDLPAGWTISAAAGVLLGAAGILAAARWANRLGRLGVATFLLLFMPSLLAVAAFGLAADRYLYLPMVGLAMTVGSLPLGRWRGVAALPAVAGLFVISQRVPEWKDGATLFAAESSRQTSCYANTQAGILAADPSVALPLFRPVVNNRCPRAWRPAIEAALAADQKPLALALASAGRDPMSGPLAGDIGFEGLYSLCLAASGQWEEAVKTAAGPAARLPTGEGAVVLAAAAWKSGDPEAWKKAIQADERRLGGWAVRLLTLAGETGTLPPIPEGEIGDLEK